MYVILVEDNNTLYASQTQRIMQRSKLVDQLVFLVNPTYQGYNMADFIVLMEYVTANNKYRTEFLQLDPEGYKGYLKYVLPIDTKFTEEAGETKLQLTFVCVELDEQGKSIQRVRKTSEHVINILPVIAWSDIIPDEALSALDQRLIKLDADIKALNEMNDSLARTKADDLSYQDNELQLMAGGQKIGKVVKLDGSGGDLSDGLPAIDLDALAKALSLDSTENVVMI